MLGECESSWTSDEVGFVIRWLNHDATIVPFQINNESGHVVVFGKRDR